MACESGHVFVLLLSDQSETSKGIVFFQTLVPPMTLLHTLFKHERKLFSYSSGLLAQRMHKLSAPLVHVVILNQIG